MNNAFYAQSGGVTPVINASAVGVIQTARQYKNQINSVLIGKNGILGALREELIDTADFSEQVLAGLKQTPGGAFGSCRYKLKDPLEDRLDYERLFAVFEAHQIGYFFYNGGGDSQDTTYKISQFAKEIGYPLVCIGIPKTIDNDLPKTDCCPGFGSVAKYIAISTLEAGLDVASMANSSTKVFILEVMGRHAGWIAAASGLASQKPNDPPHLILFPERSFNSENFLWAVKKTVDEQGYCVVVASEGIKTEDGSFVAESGLKDAFGHAQLGGVAPKLAALVKNRWGYKHHWAVSDYLQRSARHIASLVDLEQAYALGEAAVRFALEGLNAVMPGIIRERDEPYRWRIEPVFLSEVANQERTLPPSFIRTDGFHITPDCRRYLLPLIQGEAYPSYSNGLPDYVRVKRPLVPQKLGPFQRAD